MKFIISLICGCVFVVNHLYAQSDNPTNEFEKYKKLYLEENAVFIKHIDRVKISLTKDKINPIKIEATNTEELLLLNDNAAYFANRVLTSSVYAMLKDFDVYSLNADGNKYKKVKVKDIITGQSSDGMIFYDSVVEKRIYFSDVKKGTKTYINQTIDYPEPRMLRPYFFQTFAPAQEMALEIEVPKGMNIKWKIFNDSLNLIRIISYESKGKTIYKFSASNTPRIKKEANNPDVRYFVPHLMFWIENYTLNNETVAVLDGAESLYKWKRHYIEGQIDSVSPELKHIVDSLTTGQKNELDKVRNIFYWVEDHIKYVAFEAGLEGFIPRSAYKVCDRRYGDCKDMANILVSMLKSAGIKACLVWIASRDLPYKYSVTPLPNISNHMIALYKDGDRNIFLDATGQYLPFGRPTSFIQGKEALVAIDANHFEIVSVPVIQPSENATRDSFVFELKNNNIIGASHASYSGYIKVNLTQRLDGAKEEDQKKIVEEISAIGTNKFKLKSYKIDNVNNRDLPLHIQTTFEIPEYIQTNKDEIYINLNVDKTYNNSSIDTAQNKQMIESEYKNLFSTVTVFMLPSQYKVEYIPEKFSRKSDLLDIDITYSQKGDLIIQHKTIVANYLMIYPKDFEYINQSIKKLNKAYNEVVILKKK